ncbi:MAG: RRXRR domain-containing protein [Clostridiaceae bacterium]
MTTGAGTARCGAQGSVRAMRFDNRGRPEGWLAPSIQGRMEQNLAF